MKNFNSCISPKNGRAPSSPSFPVSLSSLPVGLLGLSSFSISQRIKEIGIRKVLGASTTGLVRLLSVDFLRLIALAALIAFPIAWYAMHNWLSDFAYRISIQWWVFGLAGLLAAIVALVTISFQALKAALANPVTSLRSE